MNHYARIKGVKDSGEGTDIIIHVPNKQLSGEIIRKRINQAEIRLDDGRTISNEQRKKIFATIKDIALFTGDNPEYLRQILTYDYCCESGENYFSLSDCSMTTAREFITYLLDFVLRFDIPLAEQGLNRADDINRYLYSCLKYRKCCITGKPNADIHHVTGSKIGMGRSRVKISHYGLELMALTREWHNRVHNEGEVDIFKAYKIYGIKLDKQTLNDLGLKAEDIT